MANNTAYSFKNDLQTKTDAELVEYAKNGDNEALECLLDKYK